MSVIRAGVTLAALFASVSAAQAELVYVHYEGILGFVPDQLSSAFSTGDLVIGDFSFDPNLPPREGSLDDAAVYDNLHSFSIQIGASYIASFASSLDGREIQIEDGTDSNGRTDRILVLGLRSSGLVGPQVNGFVIDSAGPHLEDSTNTALSGIGYPFGTTLADFDFASIGITFTDTFIEATGGVSTADFVGLDATITSIGIRSQPVPEPSTLAMIASGACTLIGLVIRKHRSCSVSA